MFYDGSIDAYDAFSGVHRVKYVDGEWEFVTLAAEPYMIMVDNGTAGSNSGSSGKEAVATTDTTSDDATTAPRSSRKRSI